MSSNYFPPQYPPPRGWYTDPLVPRQDRWWDGARWTEYTHRAAGPLSLGPTYTRSYWVGPNRDAGRARFFGSLGTIAILATAVLLIAIEIRDVRAAEPQLLIGIGVAISTVLEVVNVIFAARALRRSAELGARGVAISNLAVGAIELVALIGGSAIVALTAAFGAGL